jgi:hypothetical protein
MADPEIKESFIWRPWYIPDPGPPWYLGQIAQQAERETLIALAANSIQLQKDVMTAQMKALDGALAILKGAKQEGTR